MSEVLTRRQLLELIGTAAGAPAMYAAAGALGLLPSVGAAQLAQLKPLSHAQRRRVVILGAGIGGLTAAYELKRAGYDCIVLEASGRAGGRNRTLRAGDVIDELGNRQVCRFDSHPNLYMNAGPARIPADHVRLMHYCRVLQVPLEYFINDNRHAWLQDDAAFDGKPVRNRRYVTDARGFLAELAAKSVKQSGFEKPLDANDTERFLEFLKEFGDLGPDYVYRGSTRAGLASGGMVAKPVEHGPLDFSEVLKAAFWKGPMFFGQGEFQSPPMMQPIGGMDQVVKGFMRHVGDIVQLNTVVRSIELSEDKVSLTYEHGGAIETLEADYCFTNIPSHILAGIENNFPAPYQKALSQIKRGHLFKIGLQARRRFWEDEGIYGGISWTTQDITQIWYPSHGHFEAKGILLGAYTFGDAGGEKFERLSPAERLETAIRQGSKIHPNYRDYIETGVSVVWHRMNHLLGCAPRWTESLIASSFKTLQEPIGRHYLIGDQTSLHPGWQEGAMASAHHALADLNARIGTEAKTTARDA